MTPNKQISKKSFIKKVKFAFSSQLGLFVGMPALLWQLLFLFLPLIFILLISFTSQDNINFKISFLEYKKLLNYTHLIIIFRSLVLAVANTIICLLLAYPIAYYIAVHAKRLKTLLLFLLTLPFWVNFLVHIYAWFFILEHDGLLNKILLKLSLISQPLYLLNNYFAITIVMIHVYLPFMVMPIYSVLEKFNQKLIEASLDLGASHWQTFKNITLPLSLSVIKTGSILVLVMSFGEYAVPMLMGGSKTLFVGSLITEYFLMARNMPKGAAFMILSSCALIIVLSLNMIFIKINKLIKAKI